MKERPKPVLLILAATLIAFSACDRKPESEQTFSPTQSELEASARITEEGLYTSTAELSSDEFEGRGPGSRGDELVRTYLAERLSRLGLSPAFPGESWQQPLEILGITSEMPDHWQFRAGDSVLAFEFGSDYMGSIGRQGSSASVESADVVFVGYGIEAPEQSWDDYKGADVQGKILLMLNDDPDWDDQLFGGERRLYAGRWTYKYEIAATKGAVGAIIIHTTPSAGYPWSVVQSSWRGEQFELPASEESSLVIRAWLTEAAAADLVQLSGHSLSDLVASARSRGFEPVELEMTTSIDISAAVRSTSTANVGGILKGSDPELADQLLVYSAHHDHFGIGEPDETGDRIYNGALDNGVAMAQLLAVAEAFASLETPPRRSVLFVLVAAEEQGILGSRYFVESESYAPALMAANINFELGNVWGRARDVVVYGSNKSELDDLLEIAAHYQDRIVSPEVDVRPGWFYRSDQISFARAGVPAIWFKSGTDHVGRPPGWGAQQQAYWIENHYHQPNDEIGEDWQFDGLREDAELAFFLGLSVASRDEMPKWRPGDEFEAIRLKSLAQFTQIGH
jgi:Zn-dependent M28 family amino/carboxypeptidase